MENEYALITLALKKAKDEDDQPVYDIEDIYEWIEYVRKMGIEQARMLIEAVVKKWGFWQKDM